MIGPPERTRENVLCGPNIEELRPTPWLEFRSGVLHQWFEAIADAPSGTHSFGKWKPVPSSDT